MRFFFRITRAKVFGCVKFKLGMNKVRRPFDLIEGCWRMLGHVMKRVEKFKCRDFLMVW